MGLLLLLAHGLLLLLAGFFELAFLGLLLLLAHGLLLLLAEFCGPASFGFRLLLAHLLLLNACGFSSGWLRSLPWWSFRDGGRSCFAHGADGSGGPFLCGSAFLWGGSRAGRRLFDRATTGNVS